MFWIRLHSCSFNNLKFTFTCSHFNMLFLALVCFCRSKNKSKQNVIFFFCTLAIGAATNSYFHYPLLSQLISRLVYEVSENGYKYLITDSFSTGSSGNQTYI